MTRIPHTGLCLAAFAGFLACSTKPPSPHEGRPEADGSNVAEDGTGRLAITEPEDGALLGQRGVLLRGTVSVPGTTEVTVQGATVPVEDGAFRHQLTLGEGSQSIVVRAGELTARTDVFVDSLAPEILVNSPAPGTFVDAPTLRVAGRVTDPTLGSFTLDGEPVPVDADTGAFSVERASPPGAHRFRLHATDEAGHEAYVHASAVVGPFTPAGTPIPDGMAMHLGQDAIDEIARGVSDMIERHDVEAVLLAQNPVMEAWWGDLHLLGEEHGTVSTSLATEEGRIVATVVVDTVHTDFQIQSSIANVNGVADAERAVVTAPLRVTAVDGRVEVHLDEVTAELAHFAFEMDYLPSFVADWDFVRDSVRGDVEAGLIEAVESTVPAWIEWTLSTLPLEGTIPIGDLRVDVNALVEALHVDAQGLTASLGVGVRASAPSLSQATNAPGSLRLGHEEAPIGHDGDLELAVALDLLNAAVYAAWASGAFDARLDEVPFEDSALTVSTLAALVPAMRDLAPGDAPIALDVRTLLPPVVAFAKDGTLELQAAEVETELLARAPSGDIHLSTVSIAGFAPIDASFEDGLLSPSFGAYRTQADLLDGPPGTPQGPALESLLEGPFESFIPWLLDIGGLPVPSFYGFGADSPSAEVEDGYLRLGAALSYTPAADPGDAHP